MWRWLGWAGMCVSVFCCSGAEGGRGSSINLQMSTVQCSCVTVDADAARRSAESRLQCLDCAAAVCCSSLARSLSCSCTPALSIPGTSRLTLELATTFCDLSLPFSTYKNLLRHNNARISTADMLRSFDTVHLSTPRRHPDTDIAAAATSRRRDPRPRRAPRRERADQTGCGRRWLVEECENAECRRNIRHQTPCVGRHHHQVQVQVVELLLGAGW